MIVSDLDGTLISEDHITITKRTIEALKRASEQGIYLVIASGRTLSVMKGIISQLHKVDYAIVSNGAGIIDVRSKKEIYNNGLQYKSLASIVRIIEEYDGNYEIYANGKSYMTQRAFDAYKKVDMSPEFIEKYRKMVNVIEGVEELKDEQIEKISILNISETAREEIFQKLAQYPDVSLTTSLPGNNIEVNGSNVNKGKTLAVLCEMLGIKAEEVMVFGDSRNDVEMLEWGRWSFSMENGSYEAKRAAKFTTKSNGEDGVSFQVEKYLNKKE